MKPHWDHFDHEADIGIRGRGPTPASAFEQAALALTAVITPLDRIRPLEKISLACNADDLELLFADWLNTVIREMALRRMLFAHFAVHLDPPGHLSAQAWGEALDVSRHEPAVEVKAASFAGLKVVRDAQGGWMAQCIIDV